MGYEYDSKVNRDLARTAMAIYTKSQGIKPQEINESNQNINEEVLRENINSLILNYVSDVIILAEQELGREMTDVEINETSMDLLNRINSISDEDKAVFVNELAENYSAAASPANNAMTSGSRDKGRGKGRTNAVAMTPSRPTNAVGAGGQFDPSSYSSIEDYINSPDGFAAHGGAGLTQVLAYFSNAGPGVVDSGAAAAGRPSVSERDRRRGLGEAVANAMGSGSGPAPAGGGGMMAGGGRGTGAGGGRGSGLGTARPGAAAKPNLGFRPTRGQESGEFDAANYSPANYATAEEALDAMFADGFTNGQQIAMVLGQNWGGPSLGQG